MVENEHHDKGATKANISISKEALRVLFSEQEKNDWLDLPLLLLGFPSLIL
jgi:hypothetical protein